MLWNNALQWSDFAIACCFKFTLSKVTNFKRNSKRIELYTLVFFVLLCRCQWEFSSTLQLCDCNVACPNFPYVCSALFCPFICILLLLSHCMPLSPGNKRFVGLTLCVCAYVCLCVFVCGGGGSCFPSIFLSILCRFHEDNQLLLIACRCQCECGWLPVALRPHDELSDWSQLGYTTGSLWSRVQD